MQRRYSGRGNPALTDLGRRQAEAAAQYLAQKGGIAAVITSPLQRAYDTAATAAKALGLDVTVDDDLIETDFGAWEGLTFGEAAERDPELHRRWLRDTSVKPPDGESFDSVAERVRRAQARIIAEHGGETVLVVSHVTPIKTLLRLALDAGPGHPLPVAPRPCVAVHRRVLSGRCGVGAAGEPDGVPVGQSCRWSRSPCSPNSVIASTGPSTAPNQCGVHVENSTASPGLMVKSFSPRISRS